MAIKNTVLVGTVGYSIFRSEDDGKTWSRSDISSGLPFGTRVYYLVSHPRTPEVIFAGTDYGLARSDDAGRRWQILDSPMRPYQVWSLAMDPQEPEVMFAGTCPGAVFRSTDGGKSWEQRPMEVAQECPAVGVPRVTAIAIDPVNRDHIWMSIEVEGFRRSLDRGETWTRVEGVVRNPDGHDVKISDGETHTVLLLANRDLYASTDDGDTWKHTHARGVFPYSFCRNMSVQPGHPQVIFMGHGEGSNDRSGCLLRSKDTGNTWEPIHLMPAPNSSMWTVAVHAADPNLMYANSLFGYVYRSDDGGDHWQKLWKEFSEVRTLIWVPS